MKVLKRLIKINSVAVLLCFFLPFIPPMCSGSKKSSESMVDTCMVSNDTVSVNDTLSTPDTLRNRANQIGDSTNVIPAEDSKSPGIFDLVLSPDGENLSGIGYIYNYTIGGLTIISLPVSFVMLLLSLLMNKNQKTVSISVFVGFFSLLLFGVLNRNEVVYGFWITLCFYTSLAIINLMILKVIKRTE